MGTIKTELKVEDISEAEPTSSCWSNCFNSASADINDPRASHQSHESPTPCWEGWMTTIGNVMNFYCCGSNNSE